MKFYTLILLIFPMLLLGQNKFTKDLDGDTVLDSIYIDYKTSKIVCKLSRDHFKKQESKAIEMLNESSYIKDAKKGFILSNNWMRAGYENQFRYNEKIKKIRLIGMSRYEFGNAANDGSGTSSVNLLTGDYIGDWNYYDDTKNELIKIPTIKTKMYFPKIYLEDFNDEIYFNQYAEKCATLYHKYKKIKINE